MMHSLLRRFVAPLVFVACISGLISPAHAQSQLYRLPTTSDRAPVYILADEVGRMDHGPAPVRIGETRFYVDRDGKRVFPTVDSPPLKEAHEFTSVGLALAVVGDNHGYINRQGDWVVPPHYNTASEFADEGYAIVSRDDRWGVIGSDGRFIYPLIYEAISDARDGTLVLGQNGKFALANLRGEILTAFHFDAIGNQLGQSSEGLIAVQQSSGWGFASTTTGELIVPTRYQNVGRFSEGFANFVLNGKIGYVDRTGKILVGPRFERADEFSEGFAAVRLDQRWGYINTKGELVIPHRYERAKKFHRGVASVELNNQPLSITPAGAPTTPPPDIPRTEDYAEDMVLAEVHEPVRAIVHLDHLKLGLDLQWNGKGHAREVRVFRLDTQETIIWDGEYADGAVLGGLVNLGGRKAIFNVGTKFLITDLERHITNAFDERNRHLAPRPPVITDEFRLPALAALTAISKSLQAQEDADKDRIIRAFGMSFPATDEFDEIRQRIAYMRGYVDRIKTLTTMIDITIRDRRGLNDDQRQTISRIRDDFANSAHIALRLK